MPLLSLAGLPGKNYASSAEFGPGSPEEASHNLSMLFGPSIETFS